MYDHLQTVDHTVDAQGFVLVNGERVFNAKRKHLSARKSYEGCCQRCAVGRIEIPLRVVTEYEHAIEMQRYFHVGPARAHSNREYDLCPTCKESE